MNRAEMSRDMRDLLEASAVFLWVHPGCDQPDEARALLESIRSLARCAPAWCGALEDDARRALAEVRSEPDRRHRAVVDAKGLYAIAAVLRRTGERVAAAADALTPATTKDGSSIDERAATARTAASGLSVILDLLREALAQERVSATDLIRVACALDALARFVGKSALER